MTAADEPLYAPPHAHYEDRLERWKDVNVATFRVTLEASTAGDADKRSPKAPPSFPFRLLSAAREVIFDINEDGGPVFHYVLFMIDAVAEELVLSPALEQFGDDDNGVLQTLALAVIFEVPVYPRNERVAVDLARYQGRLHDEGFVFRREGGEETRFKLTKGLPEDLEAGIEYLRSQSFLPPADVALLAERFKLKLEEQSEAAAVLARLRAAIADLESCLGAESRNESALQKSLTANSILFGLQYRRVIPKHRLGAEYEMDYALEQLSGVVDLVEIEASTHPLYLKNGDPSRHLTHAEQQVLDWLSWVDQYPEYARRSLPGIMRPVGYVVIGRDESLSESDQERLRRRNLVLQGSVQLLTYDDVLRRARALLSVLLGQESPA